MTYEELLRTIKAICKARGKHISRRQIFVTGKSNGSTSGEVAFAFGITVEKNPLAKVFAGIGVGYVSTVATTFASSPQTLSQLSQLGSNIAGLGGAVDTARGAYPTMSEACAAGIKSVRPSPASDPNQYQVNGSHVSVQGSVGNLGVYGMLFVSDSGIHCGMTQDKHQFEIWKNLVKSDPETLRAGSSFLQYPRGIGGAE